LRDKSSSFDRPTEIEAEFFLTGADENLGEPAMADYTIKIQIPFLVLTDRNKKMFLQCFENATSGPAEHTNPHARNTKR
jgi:hypothetical protein